VLPFCFPCYHHRLRDVFLKF